MYFYLFFVLVTQLSYSLASTHSQNLFAISNVFTCFLISKILGLQTLHIAFKQHCSMKCISLSLINYSNPKAMLIYTCCQWCLRTLALNANCRGTKLQWQPVLLGYAFYTDSQILHWIRALEDPSEATAMWSVWSNINTYCLQKLLLSYLCLSLVPPLGWHKAAWMQNPIRRQTPFTYHFPSQVLTHTQPGSVTREMHGRRDQEDYPSLWQCKLCWTDCGYVTKGLSIRTFGTPLSVRLKVGLFVWFALDSESGLVMFIIDLK